MPDKPAALTEGIYLILLSLLTPRHGYGIMQHVDKLTHGRVALGAGTLYGAINNLLEKRWIRAVGHSADSRKKEYTLTDLGKQVLQIEIMRLGELLGIGLKEMEGGATHEN
ncbi:MAG: PadR family transcriptional regulator [Defluviitaleaceae bacterium]|nr:PadR family transcriptional regulator [Defluviitaleaceae bacterium]